MSTHRFLLCRIPVTLVCLAVVLLIVQGCKKDVSRMSADEIEKELAGSAKHEALEKYAAEIGIDTSKANAGKDGRRVFALLEEIGYGHKPVLRFTQKQNKADTALLRTVAAGILDGGSIEEAAARLEPVYPVYQSLKKHYARLVQENKTDSALVLAASLNAYRWVHRQAKGSPRLVLVNIRGAYLTGMDSVGKNTITMRTVVGKPDTPTPTMDSYATSIVTHPYWNVPKSIAIKEILPKAQKDPAYLSRNRIELIGKNGEAVNPEDIDLQELSADKFPYRFRQETGEDNSLGLLKVEIKNPLAIYLHDTNARYLFSSEQRWRSHGCVRVQHPTELANYMAGTELLSSDLLTEPDTISTPPKWHKLKQRIPVFLLYLGADCNDKGQLLYFADVYKRGAPSV